MEESRPPLFFNFKGGPLSSIFSINHSKGLKMGIYGLKVDIFKEIAILRHLEWFLEKMSESRPPPKLKNNGVILLPFSKNHSKGLKMTILLKF